MLHSTHAIVILSEPKPAVSLYIPIFTPNKSLLPPYALSIHHRHIKMSGLPQEPTSTTADNVTNRDIQGSDIKSHTKGLDSRRNDNSNGRDVHLPRVTIEYCTQCKWMLRAAYVCDSVSSCFYHSCFLEQSGGFSGLWP